MMRMSLLQKVVVVVVVLLSSRVVFIFNLCIDTNRRHGVKTRLRILGIITRCRKSVVRIRLLRMGLCMQGPTTGPLSRT